MPHNHGIRVLIGNADQDMTNVYAAQSSRLRERNRQRTEFPTWAEITQAWNALKELDRAVSAPFVEMNRLIGEITRPYRKMMRQFEQVLATLLNHHAGMSGSAYRKTGD